MKLLWADVKELFQEYTVWTHEQEMVWFEQVWNILDRKGLTIWSSAVEKMAVYNRAYGVVWIYRNFCAAGFEEEASFDFDWEAPFQSVLREMERDCEEAEGILGDLICSDQVIYTIFDVLKEHMGLNQLFASLWAACRPEEIENEEDSFEEDFSLIMNDDPGAGKHAAYEWLSGYLD